MKKPKKKKTQPTDPSSETQSHRTHPKSSQPVVTSPATPEPHAPEIIEKTQTSSPPKPTKVESAQTVPVKEKIPVESKKQELSERLAGLQTWRNRKQSSSEEDEEEISSPQDSDGEEESNVEIEQESEDADDANPEDPELLEMTQFLKSINLPQYYELFQKEAIDLSSLRLLTDQDYRDLEIPLGHKKKICAGLESYKESVAEFLFRLRLSHLVPVFQKEDVDYEVLLQCTEDDLKSMDIGIGSRKRILDEIHRLSS